MAFRWFSERPFFNSSISFAFFLVDISDHFLTTSLARLRSVSEVRADNKRGALSKSSASRVLSDLQRVKGTKRILLSPSLSVTTTHRPSLGPLPVAGLGDILSRNRPLHWLSRRRPSSNSSKRKSLRTLSRSIHSS